MNTQEREQLNNFLSQLVAAHAGQKDADAEALIRDAVARQPDAAYLLVQKAFLQEQAIASARSRIEQLQGEVDSLRATQGRGGFANGDTWGNSASRPVPQPASPGAAQSAPTSSWGSGWLGNVATTAAGVAAGAFLFQGIENLIGHHGSNSLFGGNALPQPNETTVVNNFFESDSLASNGSGFAGLSDGLDSDGDSSWI
ncbi:DUF2076 family protein [Dechloromonas sp. CZR5]|uniref:DUF2076 domain-containing protein n=1 Tax=Dechloromonas sp. CZR5 TaxID=2608630 RepID=UPI00123DE6FA|nr:DUF2076 family protein [Dechloromonas sp. CZR5]